MILREKNMNLNGKGMARMGNVNANLDIGNELLKLIKSNVFYEFIS